MDEPPTFHDSQTARRHFWRDMAMLRQGAGLTQAEVADRMDTTQSFISRLESGDGDPLRSTEDRYAAAIGYAITRAAHPATESLTGSSASPTVVSQPRREAKVLDLRDIRTMPGFNPKVPNGADSVSNGIVYYGLPRQSQGGLETVCCVNHGATLCVARMHDGGRIWRCPACNEGAYVPLAVAMAS